MRHALALVAVALVAALPAAAAGGPSATAQPTVTGALQQGKKLTALTGTWVGAGTVAFTFQWYRCDAVASHCSSIHGATKPTYTQVTKDVGHSVALTVRGKDANGTTEAYAAAAGLVAASSAKLVATAQPALAGDPIRAAALSVRNAVWSATPASTTYAWLRCNANGRVCLPIAGQTAASYTLADDDVGHTVVAAVSAVAGTAKQTVLSLRSGVVRTAPGPVALSRPSVGGTLQQGKKLAAAPGSWSSGGTIAYAYQWYRCDANGAKCSSIHGATAGGYTLVAKDVGQTIGLTVRATDSTGTTTVYAPLAGLVAPATASLAASAQPAVTGTTTLAVSSVTWTAKPGATTYAWLRCNANGRLCTKVDGATAATYAVTAADAGHVVLPAVTGTAGTSTATVWGLGIAVR